MGEVGDVGVSGEFGCELFIIIGVILVSTFTRGCSGADECLSGAAGGTRLICTFGVLLAAGGDGMVDGKTGTATCGCMKRLAVPGGIGAFGSRADFGGPSIPSSLAFFATLRAIRGLLI